MNSRHADLLSTLPHLPKPSARVRGRIWHKASQFPSAGDFRRVDRNDRIRIMMAAEGLDRRTKAKGQHGGLLGHSGLAVLRCLLFDFLNLGNGRLDPTYEAIAERTGYARDTVLEAVKRLVAAGIIEKTVRIVRERVKQWCQFAGKWLMIDRTRQTSNAYRVNFPLPDRRELGDLGAPLLNRCFPRVLAESESQTVTTPDSISLHAKGLDGIKDPELRASLERLKALVEGKER